MHLRNRRTSSLRMAMIFSLVSVAVWADGSRAATEEVVYLSPVRLCKLANKKITESSGLAASRRSPDRFWTHNDSGDKPRLFCFDRSGKHVGTCQLKKASAYDWEDMCSYMVNGQPKIMVADIGDNGRKRKSCFLHIIDEPRDPTEDLKDFQTVALRYETGSVDCEAIGVDTVRREVLLVEKKIGVTCRVFSAPLPPDGSRKELLAKWIAVLRLPIVTAMDVSADGSRAIVLTLGQAFEYRRSPTQTWADAFKAEPRTINMPPRRQGEAICYSSSGLDLYLTSERAPTPLFFVGVAR